MTTIGNIVAGLIVGVASIAAAGCDSSIHGHSGPSTSSLPADSGNAEAQYKLGVDAEDPAQAVSWYLKAAKQGNAAAQYQLGEAYIIGGGGLAGDRAAGIKWITLAAKQGDPNALISLKEIAQAAQATAQQRTTLMGHILSDLLRRSAT
jgi:TPR repeat protein